MTSIYVKEISDELASFILEIQWEMKCKKSRGKYSQSQTVVHILNEYKKIIKKK